MLLLVFFSAMIGFMAAFKPLILINKKILLSEQQECTCLESGCDGETDGETNKEDPEWDDKFCFEPCTSFRIHFSRINLTAFSYIGHTTEYFASISIPPPENL
jgi:hypothetical protein